MPYFRNDGVDFYFEVHGSGRPFVFSHGLGGDLGQVLELVGDLPNIRLIVYDNRAHGRTKPLGNTARLSFSVMAGDMAALLNHLKVSRPFVGGVSMGAGISLAFSSLYPHRVRGLVLTRPAWLASAHPAPLAVFSPFRRLMGKLRLERPRPELP